MAYIGVQPAEAYTSFAVQHFTTSATTGYTLDNPVANENEIALFINNVRQQPGSSYAYTASGTTLTLSAATSASDTMYCVFIGKAVQTVTPNLNPVTIDGATVATFNRTSSDGDIITVQKDGTTVGTIYNGGSNLGVNSQGGLLLVDDIITPTSGADNTKDIGRSSARWKDAYIGGNIYLGGTGSANTLDDYEEGTFTPEAAFAAVQPTAGATTGTGFYTKVGDMVTVWGTVENFNVTGASGDLRVRNLPFSARLSTPLGGFQGTAQISNINIHNESYVTAEVPDDLTYVRFPENIDNAARDFINKDNCSHGLSDVYFCVTYKTD